MMKPLPFTLILAALATPAMAVETVPAALTCTGPGDTADAAPHVVTVTGIDQPATHMKGAGDEVAVKHYPRGRTHVFDAGDEVLYYDRDNHEFSYLRLSGGPMLKWRGHCKSAG